MKVPNDASTLLDDEPVFPEMEDGLRRKLDYLGFAPCPVRSELRQRLHRYFRAAEAKGATAPAWFMPAGCHAPNPYDGLWMAQDSSEFPGLISETGFGDFNRLEFSRRWLDAGAFAPLSNAELRPEFREAGLEDPRGLHRVYGANPEVILADLKKLGNRPLPKTWSELLDPRYAKDVIISGEAGDIHESFLYGLYKDHGEKALEALGRNVKDFMHPAEMAKTAGSQSPRVAALYILPCFFARSCPNKSDTRVIWPEEGAYLSPLYLLKAAHAGTSAELPLDYLLGADWASYLHRVGLVPARLGSEPMPGKLRWVGWDFVRTHDLEALRVPLNAAFVRGFGK